jgi:hypothetical protein
MPLIYVPPIVDPVDPPAPELPPQPGFSMDRPLEQFEFTLSRGGESLRLPCRRTSMSPWTLGPGVDGLDMPEVSVEVDRSAGMWGGLSRDLDVPPREVFLPLTVEAGSLTEFLNERDAFDRLVSPFTLDPVRLTVRRPDGVTRWIEGHVSGPSRTWPRSQFFAPSGRLSFGLTLTCDDPWWHGEPITPSWGNDTQSGNFLPILPVRVTTDRILGGPTKINVTGDVAGWPRWTTSGPASSITIAHAESGRSWTAVGNLSPTGSLVVDTNPRVAMTTGRQVTNGAGTAQNWSWLQPPFDLWPLPPGEQTVTLTVLGATAATSVGLELTPLFRSA